VRAKPKRPPKNAEAGERENRRAERCAVGGGNILFIRLKCSLKKLDNNRIFGWETHLSIVFEKQGEGNK
jgi:hypothetical protein